LPEHLRALVVILVIATGVFVIAKTPLTAQACSVADFKRRRNLWFVLTLSAFLAHNFWLFVLIVSFALAYALRTETNRYALYLGLMLTLPRLTASIPGLGIVNELFAIDQLRLLALVVLLPTYLALRRRPDVEPFGRLLTDKLLLGILVLEVVLTFPYRTLTSVIRDSVLYAFTDIFLTYYVASRSLRTLKAFRDALGAFIAGAMVFCAVVAFEFGKYWLLYRAVDEALGVSLGSGGIYLRRAGLLRAEGTAGQSIIAGYTCAVAIGLYLYVGTLIRGRSWQAVCLLVLLAGLIGALARAPWLAVCMMVAVYIVLGPAPLTTLLKVLAGLVALVPILWLTGAGDNLVDFLPWVGSIDASTVEGREHLFSVSLQLIYEYPWFGRYDFRLDPALEVLRDGSGRIDMVNTYIIIALQGGLVSLALFAGFAVSVLVQIASGLRRAASRVDERHVLGRALLATLLGILFMIATVSPISFIYPILWSVAGLAVGYGRLLARGEGMREQVGAPMQQGARQNSRARWAGATRSREGGRA
jgi:O-antigen ligase